MTTTGKSIGWRLIMAIIIAGLLAGCASVFQDFDDKINRNRFKKDYEALEMALDAYDAGEFEKALVRFKDIKAASLNETVSRRAWLGEICCYLILADTPAKFTAAIGMWHEFADTTTDEEAVWSHALLDPLIVRHSPQPVPAVVAAPAPAVQPIVKIREPANIQQRADKPEDKPAPPQDEIEELRKKAKRADKLQLKLAKILAENRSLKDKIKALEAIDQNIQKKKTEMSTSGE